jgi:hypothetical protein
MIIPEVAPMLTCTAGNDGFLYEMVLRAEEGQPAITKIRFGPYRFRRDYQPRQLPLGLTAGGPESGFWMHKRTPRGWSRFHWEIAVDEPDSPIYLVSAGTLPPGMQGRFQFVSLFPPGGLRAGLEVYRGLTHKDYGVSGPNYEKFMHHGH